MEQMEIISKSRITTHILPYSLSKGNNSYVELLVKYYQHWCLKQLMSSQFILCKPFQEKQENKS